MESLNKTAKPTNFFIRKSMKATYLFILISTISFTTCSTERNKSQNGGDKEIKILTKKISENRVPERSFVLEASEYPEIIGLNNHEFEREINNFLVKTVEDTISTYSKLSVHSDVIDYMLTIRFSYKVIELNKNLICLKLNFTTVFGGGNAWDPHVIPVMVDLKREKIVHKINEVFDFSQLSSKEINSIVEDFLVKKYQNENVELKEIKDFELKDQQFLISNDSLILFTEQYPTAHYSHQIYRIPIVDLRERVLKREFNYLLEK